MTPSVTASTKKDPVMTGALLLVAAFSTVWIYSDWYLFTSQVLNWGQYASHFAAALMSAAAVEAGHKWATRKSVRARRRAITFALFSIALGVIVMQKGMADGGFAMQLLTVAIESQAVIGILFVARAFSRGEHIVNTRGGAL